ncbi:MAG: hypothetical protein QOE83_2280 [Actinomycetota bacterium]|jgi:hypothetical protein|nr:hypothetical protein [Actinomycetota bacterium]
MCPIAEDAELAVATSTDGNHGSFRPGRRPIGADDQLCTSDQYGTVPVRASLDIRAADRQTAVDARNWQCNEVL